MLKQTAKQDQNFFSTQQSNHNNKNAINKVLAQIANHYNSSSDDDDDGDQKNDNNEREEEGEEEEEEEEEFVRINDKDMKNHKQTSGFDSQQKQERKQYQQQNLSKIDKIIQARGEDYKKTRQWLVSTTQLSSEINYMQQLPYFDKLERPKRKFTDAKIQRKLREKLKKLDKQSQKFIDQINNEQSYSNPQFIYSWIDDLCIDQIASNFNKRYYNPHKIVIDKNEFYQGILQKQNQLLIKKHEEMQKQQLEERTYFNQVTEVKTSQWDSVMAPPQYTMQPQIPVIGKTMNSVNGDSISSYYQYRKQATKLNLNNLNDEF